jgi:DNA-binding transcriptional LysR family regulator
MSVSMKRRLIRPPRASAIDNLRDNVEPADEQGHTRIDNPRLRDCKPMTDDWNDLKLVLAVIRAGGLIGAANALGIDHSTVFRRLRAIEGRLGQPLFERLGGTYEPTGLGRRIGAAAEHMEDEVLALTRDIAGRDQRLTGHLRVTSSETLAYRLLPPHLAAFRQFHPAVVLELVIDNRVLNLTRREADVALRPMRPREGDLWGRKLADVAWTVYGANDYIAVSGMLGSTRNLKEHPLIGWDESIAGINAAEWLDAAAPASAFVFRTSSLVNQLHAAKAGIGLAVLPCYLGDPDPELSRALPPIPALTRELWIVTHTDLKRTARVRAFFDVVGNGLVAERTLFEGLKPSHGKQLAGRAPVSVAAPQRRSPVHRN